MLQSQGCWFPFTPASAVRAIWWRSRTDTLGLARHPCWHARRGRLGRLPVLCLLLHECTDRCRWNRKCSHASADRFTPAAEILPSYSPHTLVSMKVLQMLLTCTPSSTAQSAKIKISAVICCPWCHFAAKVCSKLRPDVHPWFHTTFQTMSRE